MNKKTPQEYKGYLFTEEEKAIRAKWLTWTKINYLYLNFGSFALPICISFWSDFGRKEIISVLLMLFLSFALCFGIYSLLKRCAYKKCGNKLLTLCMALTILMLIQGSVSLFTNHDIPTLLTLAAMAAVSVPIIFWFLRGLKMRRLNKTVRKHLLAAKLQKTMPDTSAPVESGS